MVDRYVVDGTAIFFPAMLRLEVDCVYAVRLDANLRVLGLAFVYDVDLEFVVPDFVGRFTYRCRSFCELGVWDRVCRDVLDLAIQPSSFFRATWEIALRVCYYDQLSAFVTAPFAVALADGVD